MSGKAPSYFWDLETLFELADNSETNFSALVGYSQFPIGKSRDALLRTGTRCSAGDSTKC